jgi:hypothetical protein
MTIVMHPDHFVLLIIIQIPQSPVTLIYSVIIVDSFKFLGYRFGGYFFDNFDNGFYSNTQEVTGISSLGCRSLKASIGTLDSFKHKISTETKIQGICCRCASWLEIKMKIEGFKFNIKKSRRFTASINLLKMVTNQQKPKPI